MSVSKGEDIAMREREKLNNCTFFVKSLKSINSELSLWNLVLTGDRPSQPEV